VRAELEHALDEIRPAVQADGGDVEVLEVGDGTVRLQLVGKCRGCPGAAMTTAMLIEPMLKEKVPGLRQVVVAS
jgi:Fe-S cluster biogenesis protein NfuA